MNDPIYFEGKKLNLAPDYTPHLTVAPEDGPMPKRRPPYRPDPDPATVARDADLGGVGLDWENVPPSLTGEGLAEWHHLAETFQDQPTRFREADRRALVCYVKAITRLEEVTEVLDTEGFTTAGRSSSDRERLVKHPLLPTLKQFDDSVHRWATQLGLTPAARRRGKFDTDVPKTDPTNPFLPRGMYS